MYLLMYLLVGVTCGWVASYLMKSETGGAAVRDLFGGILGAIFGGVIFDFVGTYALGFWDSVGTSIVGSILFLFLLELFAPHSHRKVGLR